MEQFLSYLAHARREAHDAGKPMPNTSDTCKLFVEEVYMANDPALIQEITDCQVIRDMTKNPKLERRRPLIGEERNNLMAHLKRLPIGQMVDDTWEKMCNAKADQKEENGLSSKYTPQFPDAEALHNHYRNEWSGSFSTESEIIVHFQCLELALRQYLQHHSNNAKSRKIHQRLHSLLSARQKDVQMLRNSGAFKLVGGQFPSVCWCNEMVALQRLLFKWPTSNHDTRQKACSVGMHISQYYDSPYHRALEAALGAELEEFGIEASDLERRGAHLETLLLAAAQHTPMSFPTKTLPFLQRVYKDVIIPTATPSSKLTEQKPSSPPTTPAVTRESIGHTTPTSQSNNNTSPSVAAVSPAARGVDVKEEGNQFGAKREREDDDEDGLSIRVVAARHKSNTIPKPDTKPNGTSLLDGPQSNAPAPNLPRDDVLDWVQQLSAHPPAASASPPSNRVSNPLAVGLKTTHHKYPCRSKYHNKYSTDDKHASSACAFCSLCHLMEFIFNGCVRDCPWKHAPTKKKVILHLKRFPEVYALAMRRLEDLLTAHGTGRRLPPIEIALE